MDEYVRTLNGIYPLLEIREREIVIRCDDDEPGEVTCINKRKMLNHSERIQDLFDEYVLTRYFPETGYEHGEIITQEYLQKHNTGYVLEDSVKLRLKDGIDDINIKGAIWTRKGLTYVAVMNQEGKFCRLDLS